jgi:hypothetical protein
MWGGGAAEVEMGRGGGGGGLVRQTDCRRFRPGRRLLKTRLLTAPQGVPQRRACKLTASRRRSDTCPQLLARRTALRVPGRSRADDLPSASARLARRCTRRRAPPSRPPPHMNTNCTAPASSASHLARMLILFARRSSADFSCQLYPREAHHLLAPSPPRSAAAV